MSQVLFSWERRPSRPAAEALRTLIRRALERLDAADGEVHVLVTDDQRIRSLNLEYRKRDEATDVLSFPDGTRLPTGGRLLGSIVISLDRARVQAAELRHSELRELEELALHGTIHLVGYDHSKDSGDMDALELRLRRELLG